MNEKQYLQCSENGVSQGSPTQLSMVTGTFSPTSTFNDIYSTLLPQNSTDRGQNRPVEAPYLLSEIPWDSLKLPEKIDLIEVSTKDFSPSSYCSNIDSILPTENQYNRYDGQQWGASTSNLNSAQKSGDYTSCAHISKYYGDASTSSTYCSIQKGPTEGEMFKSCAYYNADTTYNQSKSCDMPQTFYSNYSTYYDPKFSDISSGTSCYVQNSTVYDTTMPSKAGNSTLTTNENQSYKLTYLTPIDQQTEASNDESDIIVEDSSSDCSEGQEKQLFYETTKCLLCNTMYSPLGLQFYVLTSENPLTMSSQTPVIKKIVGIVDSNLYGETNYLCNDCLGLLNTIDHLQLKMETFVKTLLDRFKRTCLENHLEYKTRRKSTNEAKFRKYKCKQCKKILCLKTYFAHHIKRHKSRGYLCELCGKTASTFKKLKYHLRSHGTKDSTLISSFKCSNRHCKKTFRTKSHLKEHENFCLGILPFKCKNQYCGKKFASTTKLKNHTKLKHDKKFIAICSICNIGFVKVSDYKSHMITHNTAKKFSCSKCDKSYKTLSNLNFHLKTHNKTLPFICPICGKGFMRKEYHEAHVNNHKGIKNFGCSVCDKKFVSQKNLEAHLKYHEGCVKTNTCNTCGKVITSGFEEHLRMHSNLKEFECDFCDMKFNTKNTLAKHKKRKHLNGEGVGKS